MRDLIAIAKSHRSHLQITLQKYDAFIAIAEELAARTEKAQMRDSKRRSDPEEPHDDDKPRRPGMSRL